MNRIRCTLRLLTLVAVSVSVTHCTTPRPAAEPDAAADNRAIIEPPRSRLGNPPFYEVFGKRHYVLDSAAGYRKTGVASWYGEAFHGRATSSGEPYDMFAHTAAHTTLPLPTWVEVTHLENGKRVIVKVNDRGPFLHDRIIDLSFGAAVALDMVSQGTAPVEVRVLGAPAVGDPVPVADQRFASAGAGGDTQVPAATASVDRAAHRIYLQAGAFSRHDSADQLVGALENAGYRQVTIDADNGASPSLYRVRLGPFPDVSAVDAAIDGLVALGLEKPHLVIGP